MAKAKKADKWKEVFGVYGAKSGNPVAAYVRWSEGVNGFHVYNARSGRSLTLAPYSSMPELLAAEPFLVNPDEKIQVVHQDKSGNK